MERTRGLVLRTVRYGDSSLITDVFTEKGGAQAFLIKLPRSGRGSVKGSLFRPLSWIEFDFDYRPKVALQKMRDVHLCMPYVSLPYDPYKSAIALFLADFLYWALRNETAGDALFSYIYSSLQWLDRCDRGFANFHLVFITRLTRFLGFYPNVEGYGRGDYFDLRNACFTGRCPVHSSYLQPEEAALVPLMMRMRYDTMHRFEFNRFQRNRYLEVINDYYRLHIPDFPELKSWEVLKTVFD
ncbi:MAG: DNA repair protein RecO [Clostridium sp.]|nr:DNA repair protein RecO [Clostridium sp.]